MKFFVDTSALYALLDADDRFHSAAATFWQAHLERPGTFLTSNYILLESTALIQRRLGMEPVRQFVNALLPVLSVYWIDDEVQGAAIAMLLVLDRRQISLVDCTSFVMMQHLGLESAFTFDQHFAEQGFTCLPALTSS